MQRERAGAFELGREPLAHALGRRRAQVELGQGGAQVEARAADDDRAPALAEQLVDLGVRELCVLPDAEARVDRQKRQQPVLEPGAVGRYGRAGQRLEPGVDLQRVGGHGGRVLAAGPQQLRELDRNRGLADARRPEQRDDPHADRLTDLVQISGSTALLTGATGGIGHAIARALAARGAKLILTGRRTDVLEPLASQLGGRALAVDLAERDEVTRLIAEAGEVDILVANAALPATGTLEDFSVREIDRALDVNLRAPIVLAHGLLPRMIERRSGHLVFISSLSGKAATPNTALYNASKYGMRGFAAAIRADLRESGVGVTTVFPGFIRDAGMFADADVKLPPGVGTRTPEEVAAAVVSGIERNRGEIDVAPLPLRISTVFASLAPETASRVARRIGSDEISSQMAAGQRDKR